jgi:hypothetical protein
MSMTVQTGRPDGAEAALQGFLATLEPARATAVRVLAHAWLAAGQGIQVGRMTVRLTAAGRGGAPASPFTAGTLHPGRLELSRVLLLGHGVSPEAWTAWCDERPELASRGFSPSANYPAVQLDGASAPDVARLALGLRDLALLLR